MDDRPLARYAPLSNRRPLPLRFCGCVLASMLAHGLVLALTQGPLRPADALSAKPIRLSLKSPLLAQQPASAAAAPPAAPSTRQAQRIAPSPPLLATRSSESPRISLPDTAIAPASEAPPGPVAVLSPPPAPAEIVPPRPAPASEADDLAMLAGYTRAVSDAVAPHKQYPAIARIRGWQGTTLVEVSVGPAGKVVATKISRTSGHEVLDRQAIEMIYRAEPLPVVPDRRGERQILVRLPIQFTLVD